MHVENGHLPTETSDLHTGNGDLHTGNGDLLAGNGDLHTENDDPHNRIIIINGDLHDGFGPGYSYRHCRTGCLFSECCVSQNSGSQSENCDLQTETSDLFTENGGHNKKSISVKLAKMSQERKHRNNYGRW